MGLSGVGVSRSGTAVLFEDLEQSFKISNNRSRSLNNVAAPVPVSTSGFSAQPGTATASNHKPPKP
jgi:hypothetical protein